MRIAYFDCFSGISGDMTLGALLDCGVPLDALRTGLAGLPVSGWNIEAEPILVSGIHANDVTITLNGVSDAEELEHEHRHDHKHHDAHDHEHHDGHEHHHDHDHHDHAHDHEGHDHHHGRSMAEIREIIESSQLTDRVKANSLSIFEKIAGAEAYLHHKSVDDVHFHEIGGIDSLLDICGSAWCLDYLGIEAVFCSALPHSTGFVDCAHGRMPVPAPATLELLKGMPMFPSGMQGELVTPTGAGIVATLARGFGPPPAMIPDAIGIGSGKKRFADRPNILRVVIGETVEIAQGSVAGPGGLEERTLTVLECNIDDMNPEFYSSAMDSLFQAGALDAWLQPVHMKKGRPGIILGALCEPEKRNELIGIVLKGTTTLGVRSSTVQRFALNRRHETIVTKYGSIRVKVAEWPAGSVRRGIPEYADVERAAREHGVAVQDVYNDAVERFGRA